MSAFYTPEKTSEVRLKEPEKLIKKLPEYIHTLEYYAAIKKKAFESVLMRWMKLEPIIQSEENHKEKTNTVY